MHKRTFAMAVGSMSLAAALGLVGISTAHAQSKQIVYLTPGLDLPFWRYLSKGVAGIVLSPTDSSTAPAVLTLAAEKKIPVVIADIGTNSGDYVSFIISDNNEGAKGVGEALAAALKEKGWSKDPVGLITISQARKNGQARTNGFREGLKAGGATGTEAGLQQMQAYTVDETFKYTQDMLTANPGMRGLFVQTDQPALGALRAIKAARRQGQVLVAAFDGIPDFVDLLKSGDIVASGMQQPYLMGQRSAQAMFMHLEGGKPEKQITVPILVVTSKNIDTVLPTVKTTVFANEVK